MSDCVQVQLDLRHPQTQSIDVRIQWTPVSQRQVLQLPVWTPGSYTVRDHAQYLHGLTVSSGSTQLPVRRLEPSRWVVDLDDLEVCNEASIFFTGSVLEVDYIQGTRVGVSAPGYYNTIGA